MQVLLEYDAQFPARFGLLAEKAAHMIIAQEIEEVAVGFIGSGCRDEWRVHFFKISASAASGDVEAGAFLPALPYPRAFSTLHGFLRVGALHLLQFAGAYAKED